MITFFQSNDNTIRWSAMTQASDRDFVADATVTATLKVDSTGIAVSAGLTNVSLAYVTSSNGEYVGSVAAAYFPSSLTLGEIYRLEITATTPGGKTGFRKLAAQLVERTT